MTNTKAPVDHVGGQGGKCWCGALHAAHKTAKPAETEAIKTLPLDELIEKSKAAEPRCAYPNCGKPEYDTFHHVIHCLPDDHQFMNPSGPCPDCKSWWACSKHRTGVCQILGEPCPTKSHWVRTAGTSKPLKPIGLKIINHPKLAEWTEKGQASHEDDGLWLHYAVVCTLLKET